MKDDDTTDEVKESPSNISEINRKWAEISKEFVSRLNGMKPPQMRVVDLYDKEDVKFHLRRFMEHCMAKGVNPEIPVVLDWLYSEKAFNERDDFVKIERMIEMVKSGMVFPMLIIEVLEYAKRLEDAAIGVVDAFRGDADGGFETVLELEDVLNTRLEVRDEEEK